MVEVGKQRNNENSQDFWNIQAIHDNGSYFFFCGKTK